MKARILLIDDSKILRTLLGKIVERAGHEVAGYGEDGVQGLSLFLSTKPDFTLMDVTMPNMSGKECLEAILKHSPHAKVIMISGLADPEIEKDCLRLGAKAFISKSDLTSSGALEKQLNEVLKRFQ